MVQAPTPSHRLGERFRPLPSEKVKARSRTVRAGGVGTPLLRLSTSPHRSASVLLRHLTPWRSTERRRSVRVHAVDDRHDRSGLIVRLERSCKRATWILNVLTVAPVARSTNVQHSSTVRHGLWASAPVAILVSARKGHSTPPCRGGRRAFFSSPFKPGGKLTGSTCRGDEAVNP
jgi:hypothetical protein